MKRKRFFGIEWLALLTALCWGSGSFFGKKALNIGQLSSLVGINIRTFTALVLFLLLIVIFGKRLDTNIRKEIVHAWKTSKMGLFQIIIFEGILAGAIGMFLYYLAISGGELSIVMPLAFLSPVWGTLLAILFKDEKITFHRTIGLLLTMGGIIIITSKLLSINELLGWRIEYYALLTGLCWGIGSFFGKRGMKKTNISSYVGITIRSVVSLVILLILVFTVGPAFLESNLVSELRWIFSNELDQFFLILIFEGVIAGFLGMMLYYMAIRKGELSMVMPLAFSSPFWGTLLALIWQTEIFTIQRITGMFFILTGIIYITNRNIGKRVIRPDYYNKPVEPLIKKPKT
ncbi:MAG: EamA family transporter [Asgard group archaeon]|nr:EamA family transporter [Asgard group archaeon]